MPIPELPFEIWEKVLSLLQNPVPEALSRPQRSALAQPHLCVTARVSQLLRTISEPLLYTHITTSSFHKLVRDARTPSKRRLLALAKSLRIEYAEKDAGPSYDQLIRVGKASWEACGPSSKELMEEEELYCESEAISAKNALVALDQCMMGRRNVTAAAVFPKLEIVAISSIYGVDHTWMRFNRLHSENGDAGTSPTIRACAKLFHPFFRSPNLRHICSHDPEGPLSNHLPSVSFASTDPGAYHTNIYHFHADTTPLPVVFGRPTEWRSQIPSSTPSFVPTNEITQHLMWLWDLRSSPAHQQKARGDPLDLTFYYSTNDVLLEMFREGSYYRHALAQHGIPMPQKPLPGQYGQADQRRTTAQGGKMVQAAFREKGNGADSFRWLPSFDAPPCPSCKLPPPP